MTFTSSSVSSFDDDSSSSNSCEESEILDVALERETLELLAQVRAEIESALVAAGLSGEPLLRAVVRSVLIFERHSLTVAGEGLAEVLGQLGDSPFAWA